MPKLSVRSSRVLLVVFVITSEDVNKEVVTVDVTGAGVEVEDDVVKSVVSEEPEMAVWRYLVEVVGSVVVLTVIEVTVLSGEVTVTVSQGMLEWVLVEAASAPDTMVQDAYRTARVRIMTRCQLLAKGVMPRCDDPRLTRVRRRIEELLLAKGEPLSFYTLL